MRPETIDIDNEINSKKRILELLDPKIDNLNQDLVSQIEVRDRQLNEMNQTILALRASLKLIKENKKSEDNPLEEIQRLKKEIDRLIQNQVGQEKECNRESKD